MNDAEIVALYWQRQESALRETEKQYGRYLFRIACNILADARDSEESVNDTYWKAWNSIPPHRPQALRAYLAKIARQLSIDKLRAQNRKKRQPSQYAISLSELEDCVSGEETPETQAELELLAQSISAYLYSQPQKARAAFICRYYYADSIGKISICCGMSQSAVKSLLYRTRQGLKAYLLKEGFLL